MVESQYMSIKFIKSVIRNCLRAGYRTIAMTKLVPEPKIIVKMDGGLCSQMHFWVIGQLFREKGYRVSYDTTWFRYDGLDCDGRQVRNFDLLKLFPDLPFSEATPTEKFVYDKLFIYWNDYYNPALRYLNLEFKPPRMLSGYYRIPDSVYGKFGRYFRLRPEVLNPESRAVYDEIKACDEPVAVHVRRGDLSKYHKAYGVPVSTGYFVRAFAYMRERTGSRCRFFVFSDDADWCRAHFAGDEDIRIVAVNGPDRGYMDLVLMAACRHFVVSKGTLGKYAAILADKRGEVLIGDDEFEHRWADCIPEAVFLPI